MLGTDGKVHSWPPKSQTLTAVLQNCEKSAVTHFIEKPKLLNFMDFSTIVCPRLKRAFSWGVTARSSC